MESVDGVLIVDKPGGPTSHDVVAAVRRATGWLKVGHTGTLDPMATGVLPLVVGRATRLAPFLSAADKVYEAEVRLGWATDTYDAEGMPIDVSYGRPQGAAPTDQAGPPSRQPRWGALGADPRVGPQDLDAILDRFRGSYLQAAPAFSAKKIDGVRGYTLARKGAAAVTKQCRVTVHELTCLGRTDDCIWLRIRCSAGFYVRTLAHELGIALGGGAHLSALRRTRSGDFDAVDTVPLEAVLREGKAAGDRVLPLERLLPAMPVVVVTAAGAIRALHGNELRAEDLTSLPEPAAPRVRVVDEDGALLAIAEACGKRGVLHPRVVVR